MCFKQNTKKFEESTKTYFLKGSKTKIVLQGFSGAAGLIGDTGLGGNPVS